eukprot:403341501
MGCSASSLELTTQPNTKETRPWVTLKIPPTNITLSQHHHNFPKEEVRDSGWKCNGPDIFPQGCFSGITDFYQTKEIPGYNCSDKSCDFDLCHNCVQYSVYCDHLIGTSQGSAVGSVELNNEKKAINFKKLVIKNDVIQGFGVDSEGDFTINGYVKRHDVKFKVYHFGQKTSVIYFGTLSQRGDRISGNQFKNDVRSKMELTLTQAYAKH